MFRRAIALSRALRGRTTDPMRGPRDPITALQRAIRCLPVRTREAMLEGIRTHTIVAGAYTDGRGGIWISELYANRVVHYDATGAQENRTRA